MNLNEGMDDEVVVDDLRVSPIPLNFGEIMVVESSLKNYEEDLVGDVVSALPLNRPAFFIKDLLLKVGSAYIELYDHRSDADKEINVFFNEKELWVLRQVIQPNVQFNNVSISPFLKKKIFGALINLNSPDYLETEVSVDEPSKYDRAEAFLEWKRTQKDT
jgi:hypothetical protein